MNAFLWLLDSRGMSFDDLLARVRWRYPVSCSGAAFEADLRRLFDLTPAERESRWFEIMEQAGKTAPIRQRVDARGNVAWISYPRSS